MRIESLFFRRPEISFRIFLAVDVGIFDNGEWVSRGHHCNDKNSQIFSFIGLGGVTFSVCMAAGKIDA